MGRWGGEGWVTCCQPFDPIAALCMWHPLISFSFLSVPAPYQLNQNKNNPIAKDIWGMLRRGRTHRKREWTVKIFKFWGKARYYVSYSERERECVRGGGEGLEGSTGAVYGQCCLYQFRHWKFFLFFKKFYLSCCAGFYLLHTGSSSLTRDWT